MLRLVGIGALGNMLSPAATHLSGKNTPARFLRIYDRNPINDHRQQRRMSWVEHGAKIVANLEDLMGDDIDGVVMCVGKNGDDLFIISKLISLINKHYPKDKRPFILHCSTVSIHFVEAAFGASQKAGIQYVNYPLTGGAKGAQAGTMLILASGSKTFFDRLEPFLVCLGQPKYFDEDVTAAAKIKFVGHLMVFNGLLGISSAVALQDKSIHLSGISQSDFFDFLNQGAGGTRQWDVTIKQALTQHEWRAGFLLPHAAIDAIYTADLLIQYALPTITIFPILQIACAFSFLLRKDPQLATQTFLKVLQEAPKELEKFISQHQDYNPEKFLNNIIETLPNELHEKVKLKLNIEDFEGAQ